MRLHAFISQIKAYLKSIPKVLENLADAIRSANKPNPHHYGVEAQRIETHVRFADAGVAEYRRNQTEQSAIQRSMKRAAWCAFWAAAIYAAIALCQFHEMQKQTIEANRAWVSIDAPLFMEAPQTGRSVPIEIPYINVGREPGINAYFSAVIDVIARPGIGSALDATKLPKVGEDFCKTNPPDIQAGVIFPEQNPATLRKNSGDFGIVWTEEMQRDKKLLRLRACLSYESFGKVRHTWACKVFWTGAFAQNSPGILIGFNCPDGGGAD